MMVLLAVGVAVWTSRPSLGAAPTVQLTAREFLFDPKEVTARSGEVTFVVTNMGAIEHNFILEDGVKHRVAQIPIIEPGQTLEVKAAIKAGVYAIYCSLPGHKEIGMVATLKVNP